MTIEEWRPVLGHDGAYEVSSLGRVRSLPRTVRYLRYEKAWQRVVPGRMLSIFLCSGYPAVAISHEGTTHVGLIHALICEAWFGPRPVGAVCRHLDGDPTNSTLGNVVWGTPYENTQDLLRHGRHQQLAKTHCAQGHPYDEANTYVHVASNRGLHRVCRTCNRIAVDKYKARKAVAA